MAHLEKIDNLKTNCQRVHKNETRWVQKIFIMGFLIFLESCGGYVQLFNTVSLDSKLEAGYWVYETDSVKITYEFWANKGVMSFSIYNKLNFPIYIDWKNSSFVYNGSKLNYWEDEFQTTSKSTSYGYLYSGPLLKPGYLFSNVNQFTTSQTIKPERLTFIPPNSTYYRSQFYLLPIQYFNFDEDNLTEKVVQRNDLPNKNTVMYEESFSVNESPLIFRNFLAFTTSESSNNFFYSDNEFFLSQATEMKYSHFKGKSFTTENNHIGFEYPFRKGSSFFLKINRSESISFRRRYDSSFK